MSRQNSGCGNWCVLLPPEQREFIGYRFNRIYNGLSTPEHLDFAELYKTVAARRPPPPPPLPRTHSMEGLMGRQQPHTDRLAVQASDADFEAIAPQKRKYRAHPTPEEEDRKTEMVVTFCLWAGNDRLRRLRRSRQRWKGLFLLRTMRRMRDLRLTRMIME